MSITEAVEEEATRQVHATHKRIMTKSDLEPARKRPSGFAFRDTSSVSNKMSLDPSQMLKGSSEGTGTKPGVPDESTVTPTTSSEGTDTKPRVPDEEKVTFEAKADVTLDWGSEEESEYTEEDDDDENIKWVDIDEEEDRNDDDDDKSIDLEKTDNEETDDEFVHREEYIQDDDEETHDETVRGDEQVNDDGDEEMTNAEDANIGNGDEVITYTAKEDAKKTEEAKDDIKKTELPPTSSSLSVSSGFDVQELKEVDNTITLCASLGSEIPSAINAYLGSSQGDALQKILQKHTEELI
ncbi:hypothetical protein Tco_0569506 [Tanacetum coccineum]